MVLERETWLKLPPDTVQMISFAGLVGDGAPLISSSNHKSINASAIHSDKSVNLVQSHTSARKSGFSHWLRSGNPFLQKLSTSKEGHSFPQSNGSTYGEFDGSSSNNFYGDKVLPGKNDSNQMNGTNSVSEEENEDLLADFIDEDSQLPSRSSKPNLPRRKSLHCNDEENTTQTGSSLSLLRLIVLHFTLAKTIIIFIIFTMLFYNGCIDMHILNMLDQWISMQGLCRN